ncbi:molybdenum cofactor guanylyltransferase MobA [Rhizobium sp. EC-SD404]|uniref:molybdenum cofactor guanylyltransferase MobA n=1 Tax=Rhizobium sp. EC-SD404 TaxID=2038389 RepID=UPI001252D4DD|nr:molybdenum cofactor guanylyltransferase MobA [Rhizobium sp. EC-SD404]VVT23496.1 Molybdenum cofactor guanylyltransferase [Rhizobium sp. EC-SD404]
MTGPSRKDILGCVLAGGLSRRMGGGDKALLEIRGVPMLTRVIDRLKPQVSSLVLNANGDAGRFAEYDLPVIADTVGDFAGPLAGVLAGMRHAQTADQSISHVATAASDTPFFPVDLVERFAEVTTTADTIALATSDGNRHPVFGLWPVALADDLETWLKESDTFKVLAWVHRHRLATVDFDLVRHGEHSFDPFFNANTPEDMIAAETFLREQQIS